MYCLAYLALGIRFKVWPDDAMSLVFGFPIAILGIVVLIIEIIQKMKTKKIAWFILFLIILLKTACMFDTTIIEQDPSAGLNGSFEKTKHHLPLNWTIYAATDYQKNYTLSYDTVFVKEGKQSLKFEIQKVDPSTQLSRKPGFLGRIDATSGKKYKVSFWVKNKGCDFRVTVYNAGNRNIEPIIRTNENFADWKYFEQIHEVSEKFPMLNFEVNIFSPGTFWIDDVRIEKIEN